MVRLRNQTTFLTSRINMQAFTKFRAWLATRKGNITEAIRIRKQAEEVLKWNEAVVAGKISRKGHRKS